MDDISSIENDTVWLFSFLEFISQIKIEPYTDNISCHLTSARILQSSSLHAASIHIEERLRWIAYEGYVAVRSYLEFPSVPERERICVAFRRSKRSGQPRPLRLQSRGVLGFQAGSYFFYRSTLGTEIF